jgi:hypothetical protein
MVSDSGDSFTRTRSFSGSQIERFRLEFMEVQLASLTFADFKKLSAIQRVVSDPYFPTQPLGFDVYRFAYSIHRRESSAPLDDRTTASSGEFRITRV